MDVLSHFLEELKKKGALRKNSNVPVLARALIALYDGLIARIIIGVEKSEVWLDSTSVLVNNLSLKQVRT